VTYGFEVIEEDGPLAGTTAIGVFSFEDSIVPSGGGTLEQAGLITDLDFTWDGVQHTEATANTGFLGFDASGALIQAGFGTTCIACPNPDFQPGDWLLIWNFPILPGILLTNFIYAVDVEPFLFSTQDIRVCPGACTAPEPGTLALVAAAAVWSASLRWLRRQREPVALKVVARPSPI
jgi:hypothetical protein